GRAADPAGASDQAEAAARAAAAGRVGAAARLHVAAVAAGELGALAAGDRPGPAGCGPQPRGRSTESGRPGRDFVDASTTWRCGPARTGPSWTVTCICTGICGRFQVSSRPPTALDWLKGPTGADGGWRGPPRTPTAHVPRPGPAAGRPRGGAGPAVRRGG